MIILLILIISFVVVIFIKLNKNNQTKVKTENIASIINETVVNSEASPINIDYLRSLNISSAKIKIEEELVEGSNYKRYIASYSSEGNKVYGLLTIPTDKVTDITLLIYDSNEMVLITC